MRMYTIIFHVVKCNKLEFANRRPYVVRVFRFSTVLVFLDFLHFYSILFVAFGIDIIIKHTKYHMNMENIDHPLIKAGNLEELLRQIPYSACPEFAFNSPLIQGCLIYDAISNPDPLIQARAYYLLHILLHNMILRSSSEEEDRENELMSKNALNKATKLLQEHLPDADSQEVIKQWSKTYQTRIQGDQNDCELLFALRRLDNTFHHNGKEKWAKYQTIYDQLQTKYIDESIRIAIVAFQNQLPSKIAPKEYLKYTNTPYYAVGYIEMAHYLRKVALVNSEMRESWINLAQDLYRKAVMEFNDIRGYKYLQNMNIELDEEVRQKGLELNSIYKDLQSALVSLFSDNSEN